MSAAELLNEYRGLREQWLDTGEGRYRTQLAYERYWRQACAEGHAPDSLQRLNEPEEKRFFDRIISGPDGHNYWDGPVRFRLDTGGERNPRYWWYEHLHGTLPRGRVKSICSELHCITPARGPTASLISQRFGGWRDSLRAAGYEPSTKSIHKLTPELCIEGLKFVAGLLGRAPSDREYRAHAAELRERGLPAGTASIRHHVAPTWGKALKKAGLR